VLSGKIAQSGLYEIISVPIPPRNMNGSEVIAGGVEKFKQRNEVHLKKPLLKSLSLHRDNHQIQSRPLYPEYVSSGDGWL
jgi:hypothetical protein